MEGVRGSSPLSSTQARRPVTRRLRDAPISGRSQLAFRGRILSVHGRSAQSSRPPARFMAVTTRMLSHKRTRTVLAAGATLVLAAAGTALAQGAGWFGP